uniref:Flagella membrane glycoprotein 1B n=1 Tax=Chlamydomonas reinhardtii TaxID=3055 RepID=Q84X68_CHLRE|nr:flagella membrane glycoprotein 1B [Chlamydomonas reinhardtii]
MPDGYATNMTICGAAVQLLSAAGAVKASPFSACLLAADTLTLTLTSSGTYAPGDVVNVVAGQSTLKNGATSYTKSAAGSVIRPTLTTVSLATTTTILIGASAPVSLPANASADVCNSIFTVALKSGTALPTALSACMAGPAVTAITATFANGTTYSDGLTVTIKANQTLLRTGDQSASSPLFLPPASALVIAPTVLSASLTSATSITVQLPVSSTASGTLDAAGCNGAFELRAAGSSASKSSPFSACALASNNTALVLTLASASTYTAGDIFNVKSGQSLLQVGSTAYVPQAVSVLPTLSTAILVAASVVRVGLPVVSSIPAPYSADDCARSVIIAAANSTAAKAISGCVLSADGKALLVTLGAAYAAGDTVNVRTGQWQLRAGASVTLGPNYIAASTPVAIVPGFSSAVLTSATQVTVQLPLASALPATISASECGDAFDLLDASGTTSRVSPWTGCSIGSNNTLVLNMTAGIYVVGDQVTPKSGQTKLTFANTTAYGVLLTPINPILTAATTAMLTASSTIVVALPYAANLPASTNNGTVCNAAFDLVSAAGASRTAPFSACSISGGTTLTLTIASTASYTAGDRINVKSGNSAFLGSLSASGPAFVHAGTAIVITPTVVSTALISNTNVFVSLSAPTSASAFNQSICNGAFDVSGLATPFTNCTLSADGTGISFLLASAGSVTSGVTTINVKSSQLFLLAAGSGSSDSPAFVPRGSALTISEAKLAGAYLTAANTIIVKLSVAAAAVDGFSSSCNNVFTLFNSSGTARASPFSACTLSTDGLTVTLTTSSWVSTDKLNIRSDQTLLKVLGAANGPSYPALSSATEVSPAITSAHITSPTTIIVPLPVASDLTGSSCSFLVLTAATSNCALSNNGTLLTVTLSGSYTIGDTININALNSALRGTSSTGALYQPVSGATAATIQPTIGAVQVTTSTRLLVTLPAAMSSPVPNPLTADACNAALDLSGKSSPFAACTASGTTLTLDLASAFVPGDRLNVKSTNTALRLGTGASALFFQPLATSPANILNPTFVSAKATSTSVVVVSLPAASTFVKSGSATAGLVKADCDTVLAMSSGSLVGSGNACDLNTTSSSQLIVTLAGTTYAPGQTINVLTTNTMLLAGSSSGPAYQPRTITINPAYLSSDVVATAPDTVVVTLPVTSGLFAADGSSLGSTLTAAQCATVLEVKAGTTAKGLASCSLAGTTLTVKLLGNNSDVYTGGDTFNFKDTNALLLAGSANTAPAYKALATAAVIVPNLYKAVASAGDTILITLPAASTFVVSGSAVLSVSDTVCNTILTFTNSKTVKSGTNCVITGAVLSLTLNSAITDQTTVTINSGGQTTLVSGTGTTGPAYKAGTAAPISPAYLTSAAARSATSIVVTLPFTSTVNGATLTKATCDTIVEVLNGGDATKPRTLDSGTPCTLATTLLTVNLAATESFAPGDTVRIKSGNTVLLIGSAGGNAPYVQATTATPIALGYVTSSIATKATEIKVTLPVPITLIKAGVSVASLDKTDCDTLLTVASGTLAATGSCALSGTVLTITTTSTYTPGTTTVQFTAVASSASVKILGGAGTTGTIIAALSAASSVLPGYLTSAVISGANTFTLTLPYAVTSGGNPTCSDIIEIKAANGAMKTFNGVCSVASATTVTGTTNEALLASDTVTLKGAQNALTTTTGSKIYAATAAINIQPAYLTGAYAIDDKKFVVVLPYASTLAAGTCSSIVSVTDNNNGPAESGCSLALDGTGIYLTVTVSASLTATAWKVDFKAAQTALTVGSTAWAPMATGTAKSLNAGATTWGSSIMTATAVATNVLEVTLPMSSYMADISSGCSPVTFSTANTAASCKLIGTTSSPNSILQITLTAGYVAGAVSLANAAGLIKAGSASGTAIGAASTVTIKPTFVSAVATGPRTIVVALPIQSKIIKGAPTCTGGAGTTGDTCDDDIASPADCSTIFSLTGGTATIAGCSNPGSDFTAPYTTTVTLATANWVPGTTLSVAADQAAAAATNYLKPTAAITLLYTTKPSGAVVIYPSISSATLTGPKSLQVTLPVAASVPSSGLSPADCNNIFQLYATGTTTPKTAAVFSACYLGADKQTFYLTLAAAAASTTNANTYAVKDLINIKAGQSLLKADSATAANRLAFAPLPDALLIRPAITSAVATTIASAAVIKMQLPLTSNLGTVNCATTGIKVRVDDATDKTQANTGACSISSDANGAVLTLTLNQALGASDFTTGKGVSVVVVATSSADATKLQLFGGSDNTGPLYVTGSIPVYDVVTPGQSIVSAKAIASNQVEIKLPAPSTITTGNTCANFLAFTPTRTISSCVYDAETQLVTATVDQFAAGDAVNIAGAPNLLKYATAAATLTDYAALAAAATVSPALVSAYTVDSTTIAVVLPATSSFYSGATNSATKVASLTDVECADVLTVLLAGKTNSAGVSACATPSNCRTLFSGAACLLGTTSAGDTLLTIKLGASYAAGDAVDVWDKNAGLNGATAAAKPLRVGTNVQALYVPRRMPVVIEPRIVSASATGARTIAVTLPVTSQLIDSTGTVISAPTQQQCASLVALPAGKSVASCAISSDFLTLTLTLAADFAPGDTVNIASGQTLLRAWKSDVGPGYELSGPLYTPSASAVTVTLSFFVSATSTAANTIVVTLPFPVKMYDLAASPAEILAADGATPTKDNCDSVIRVIPSGSTIARTLVAPGAGVAPCVLSGSGTTITLTLDTTVSSYATGDRIDVGFGNSANLRGAATAAAVANTSPKYTTVATLNAAASAAVVTIGPSIVSAAAASPTQVKVTLSATGTITTTPATVDDCNKIVTFTPAKTLAATSPCSVAGTTLTVNLDKATPYAGTDAVNIAAANSLAATTNPLKAGSLAFVAKATAVTIDPNLYTATAIDSLVYEVALPAASSVGSTALTAAQCGAILSLTGGRTISSTVTAPCVLDTTKTLLTVSLGTAYADGDTVTLQSTQATPWLRAASDTGPAYKVGSTLIVKPTIASAKATTATTIEVTLPVTSVIWSTSGGAAVSTALTATECGKILSVKRGSGTVALSASGACSLSSSGSTTLTVTLASDQVFQAGDKINILASNTDSANTDKYLVATTSSSGQAYIARSSDVVIAPGFINAAYAVGPNTLSVALPVVSSIATDNDCSTVVTVRASATPTTTRTVSGACTVASDATGYYLVVTLAAGTPFVSGDEVLIKSGNTALVGSIAYASGAAGATKPIYANFDDAILTAPTTVLVTMAAVTTVSFTSKADCDAVFVFSGAGNTTKTTSPIASCALAPDGLSVTITLSSADAYVPGDAINVVKDQTSAKVGGVGGTNLVPYPTATTISPRPFGAKATLVAPTSVAFSLPAVSSLPAATAAADCNAAVRYTDVAGVDAVNPFTSCALTPDTKGVVLNTASPIYKAGDVMNIKSGNAAVRWGPQASGAAYYPAAADVPVFATVATATLVDPSTVVLNLPTVSAIPDNFTVPDCLRAIEFKTAAGVTKNGTVASCMLMPDRLGLQVKLLSAGNFSAGDTVNIKPEQAELRSSALATGPSYVPKLAAQVVNPALFANANLTSATAITVRLPFASALATGADCKAVLALLGAGGVAKNVSSCSLGADGVTLAVTIPAASFVGGDVLNIVPGQRALTLADGTTAYVPSKAGVLVTPNIVSATLTNATIVTVALPTASVLTSTAAADCNAAVVIARNGSAVASPLSACAVSADGLSLTLTAAATYKPMAGDTVDVAVSQTVLRAGSATGPAYVPRPSPALITVPSPPPSPPPSPAPSPPPSPPLSTANYSARGLATGPLSCNVLIGDLTVTTTAGNFTGMASYAGKDASYKGSCKDAVTGAVYTDDTVASTLPAGLTGLVLSPVTALASVWDLKSVADLANTNKDYLRLFGVPVNASAYGTAVQLLAYDYYVKGFVALETPAVAVLNVEGMVAANLLMYTKFFDGLNTSVAGRDITAAQALAAGQYALAAVLEDSIAPINTTDPASILALLNVTYSVLTANATSAAGRRLLQTAPAPFTQLQAQATALAAAAAGSNALVAAQQARLITAINAGTSISAAELTNIINEASKVIVAQSTVIATAATGLGSGAISPASFTSSYTGSALSTLVAQQQLAATPGSDVTAGPAPSPPSDKKKSNTGLIVGLVVGLVGGAIVITLIVVFIVMRRRKQNVAAAGQATA